MAQGTYQAHTLDFISMHTALHGICERFNRLLESQNQVSYHTCLARAIAILTRNMEQKSNFP